MKLTNRMNIEDIAQICHEANRAYCETMEDGSQVPWDESPQWQRDSALSGVKFHIANPDSKPRDSHEAWYEHKLADGWSYGDIKNPETKEHPCMVPFEELPIEQQRKDKLFLAIVRALTE